MSEPFLGEVRWFGFTFAPRGWADCNGQLLPISQNTALFSLLGTTYGGDGETTFALPDLRGRAPVHGGSSGNAPPLGTKEGQERVVLGPTQMAGHTHVQHGATGPASTTDSSGNMVARTGVPIYAEDGATVAMDSASVATTGGQSHENMQPFLTIRACIALNGTFPS